MGNRDQMEKNPSDPFCDENSIFYDVDPAKII